MFSIINLINSLYFMTGVFGSSSGLYSQPVYTTLDYYNNANVLYNRVKETNEVPSTFQSYYDVDYDIEELGYNCSPEMLINASSQNLTFTLLLPNSDFMLDNWDNFGTDFDYVFDLRYIPNDGFTTDGVTYDMAYLPYFLYGDNPYNDIYENVIVNDVSNRLLSIRFDAVTGYYYLSLYTENFYNVNFYESSPNIEVCTWEFGDRVNNQNSVQVFKYNQGNISIIPNQFRFDAMVDNVVRIKFYYGIYENMTGYYDSDAYNLGQQAGYIEGYNDGLRDGNPYNLFTLFGYVIDTPILYLKSLFDYEILGVNIFGFFASLLSLCLVLWVIRRIL